MTNTDKIKFTPETVFAFEQGERVKAVDYSLLEHSLKVTDSNGNPELHRPVQAFTFLCLIEEMIRKENLNYTIEPVWIQNKAARRVIEPANEKLYAPDNTPISKWLLNNMITRIHLPHAEDLTLEQQGANVAIAIAYKDKGIEVAFGLNEKICNNMQILSRSGVLRTYGSNSFGLEAMLGLIKSWLGNFEDTRHVEMEKMDRMKNCKIGGIAVVDTVVGKLYRAAINQSYGDKTPAPLDTYGTSSFVQQIMNSEHVLVTDPSVWDVYNWGTMTIKPNLMDLRNMIETSAKLAEFLLNEFNLS